MESEHPHPGGDSLDCKPASRSRLIWMCVWTILFCGAAKSAAMGWFMLLGIFVFPVFFAIHISVLLYAVWSPSMDEGVLKRAASLSNAALVAAFLLQYDLGDDSGWLTITSLVSKIVGLRRIEAVSMRDSSAFLYNTALFVPVIAMWIRLVALGRSARKRASDRICSQCGYPLHAASRCPECGFLAPEPSAPTQG